MPEWLHSRAKHILDKGDLQEKYGPEKAKQIAFGVATQQSHALGKTPKDYGTAKGKREAKQKYHHPSTMTKTADPKESSDLSRMIQGVAFADELAKIAAVAPVPVASIAGPLGRVGGKRAWAPGGGLSVKKAAQPGAVGYVPPAAGSKPPPVTIPGGTVQP